MHRDGWIVLAVAALGYYYLHSTGQVATSPAYTGPGSATDPGGTLVGSNIPFGPAGPPDTGNGGSSGTYGPALPDGTMYTNTPTGKGIYGDTVDQNGPIYSPPNRPTLVQ